MAKAQRTDSKGRKLPEGISERADGRYLARFTVDGKRYLLYNKNLAELKKDLAKRRLELESGQLEPEKIVLNTWFDRWLDTYKKDKIKPQTYTNYKLYYNWYVRKSSLGTKPLASIKKTHVVEFCKALMKREKPLSINTVKYVGSILYCCMEEAVDNDLLARNPVRNVISSLANQEDEADGRDSLSEADQEIFLNYIRNHRFYSCHQYLMEIMFYTGMRVGEVCALTWKDIDLEEGVINVDKTLSYRKGSVDEGRVKSIGRPKTKQSIRKIPMLLNVKRAFIEQKKMLKMSKRFSKDSISGFSDFVFLSEDGTSLYPDYVTAIIKKIIVSYNHSEAECAEKEKRPAVMLPAFTAHWIRHTFRTRCFNKKMRNEVVQAIMGHKPGSRSSDEIYLHIEMSTMEDELKVMEVI